MKYSYVLLPDYPLAAAATQTENIRFGPSLSSVVLREPT